MDATCRMNTAIQQFKFNNSPVRVVEIDGEFWFVAKDICDVLGLSKYRDAVSRLDDDERGLVILDTLGGAQEMSAVNEAGLYKLAFRSRKQVAKDFTRWVAHEVLPAIRKTGRYAVEPGHTEPAHVELLDSTRRMLHALNLRLEDGEDVPPHVLKYAWNLANLCRLPLELKSAEFHDLFTGFVSGTVMTRGEFYEMYRASCSGSEPLSPRRFWPVARRTGRFDERRTRNSRLIVIL